ncbi:bifunctional riboflavin kinase/FMN phosphatase-like isoform X1 [Salvia splendens]|uniref:bifunctional riboflavin kinase/FMN phosphatase-like isoform X1 n=1 Tax=Salvia splendens TaxID=180675 RepID=UPI001C25AF34|nr:bifunctional riboflavin kinase/FMN phosphatase-like isoform X1 [Salvia splendens]
MGSAAENSSSDPQISAVIFDLDGTLLNTEDVTKNVLKNFLAKYGRVQDSEKERKRLGMTFKESSLTIVDDYDLPLTTEEYVKEILPMYQGTWLLAKPLPGANRLMRHLHKHGVPFGLASNSLRKNIEGKISHHDGWKDNFNVILGSDEVKSGKPAPDLFFEAAKRMEMDPSCCLVIEDSVVGVKAGKAANMKVVAVPSLENESDSYSIADSILHSLLDFQPEHWGLPEFDDWVDNALPTEPILLTGVLSNGLFQAHSDNGLSDIPSQIWGLYIGWAKLDGQVSKAVISISSKKTIQPCLLDGDHVASHDNEIQLLLVGYLRRSCSLLMQGNMLNSPEVVDEDKVTADAALDLPEFSHKLFEC